MKTSHSFSMISLILALLLAITSSGLAATPDNDPALLFLNLSDPRQAMQISAAGAAVHARVYDPEGHLSLLAFADAGVRAQLASQSIEVQILDLNPQGKDYYLGWQSDPRTIRQALGLVPAQQLDAQQILFAGTVDEVETLLQIGLEVKPLSPIPLPLSQKPNALPEALTPDPFVQAMIDQVTSSAVYDLDGDLSGEWPVTIGGSSYTMQTRHSSNAAASEKATQFAYEYLQAAGLDTQYHPYNHPFYGSRRNVVAEQPGTGQPERIFIIAAHLDDMPSGPTAPGADDNASGSAAVLLAADILSQYNFDCTLRYLLVTGEEQGLYGSYYYAQSAYNAGDDIEAVLNLDMIAYNSDTQLILDLHTRPGNSSDLAIANTFVDVVNAYDIDLTPHIHQDGMGYSDHDSFWDFGFPAILAIEDDDDFTPYYHTVNDKLSTLDLDYFTSFVQAAVGTLAHMGCLAMPQGSLSGTVTANAGGMLTGATITARQGGSTAGQTNTAGDGSYSLDLLEGSYTVQAAKFGYQPQSISGVQISNGQVTNLDFVLQTCAPFSAIDFSSSHEQAEVGETVSFSATVTGGDGPFSYDWDFGDGSTASGQQVQHAYTISATHTIALTVSNCAAVDSLSKPLWVYGVPRIQLSPTAMDYSLDKSGSTSSPLLIKNVGGENLTWSLVESPAVSWLNHSKTAGTTLPTQTSIDMLTFNAPASAGIYTTSLVISSNDPDNGLLLFPITLTVPGEPLSAVDFSYSPAAPRAGQTVTFTAAITGGDPPVQYAWDFGDGQQASGQMVTHIFAQQGPHTITLIASNLANSVQASQVIDLAPGCVPVSGLELDYNPPWVFVNTPVGFSAYVSAGTEPISYQWDFGDGQFGSGSPAAHSYPSLLVPHQYTVTLTASNACSAPQVQALVGVHPYGLLLPLINH